MSPALRQKSCRRPVPAAESALFQVHCNYVALPPSEAFRIEYWALEEAKIRRQPPEKELSRHIALIVGGGSGIGREVVRLGADRGAHVVAADRDIEGAQKIRGVRHRWKGIPTNRGGRYSRSCGPFERCCARWLRSSADSIS